MTDEQTVERVAKAMWDSRGNSSNWEDTTHTALIGIYSALARAAIAALQPEITAAEARGREKGLREAAKQLSLQDACVDPHVKIWANNRQNAILSLIDTPAPEVTVREAAREVVNQRMSTFRAKNGRQVSIEDDNGEMCWIIPFDAMDVLDRALAGKDVS